MPIKPYCPVCKTALDEQDKCWAATCELAGISQPPIHFAEFEVDVYEVKDGSGSIVRVYVEERLVGFVG